MRKVLLLWLTALVAATMAASVAAEKGGPTELPFKGMFSGVLLGFNEDPEVIADRCDNTPQGKVAWAVTSFEGWGTATHMGRTYVYAEHCSYAVAGVGPDGTYGQGELTLFAANGDMLSATYANGVSLSPPPIVGFTDYLTFDDEGTGRFNFASGGGVEIGSVDLSDGSFTLQMAGEISYSKR